MVWLVVAIMQQLPQQALYLLPNNLLLLLSKTLLLLPPPLSLWHSLQARAACLCFLL
jgi:hypothetical protein